MSSWYSNLLTNASRLQRTYFGGETDGDTDDDTLVCRVLRAYYTEKGQAFPEWLPPDPRAPPPQQPVLRNQPQQGRYGSFSGSQSSGGLSSLWGDNNSSNNNAAAAAAGGPGGRQGSFASSRNPFASSGGGGDDPGQRPGMLGQRGQSYQVPSGQGNAGSGGATSAQEKLKQRLWGGARTASPTGGGPFQPPPAQQQASSPAPAPAPQQQSSGSRWGWGSQGGNNERPVMSANAPWADGGFDYPGGAISSFSTISHPRRSPSPSGSFYAMSDDEEGDYDTITHSPTGRRGVKLLFTKSKVYVHPTPSARDNIPGYIALLQQKHPITPPDTSSSSHETPSPSSPGRYSHRNPSSSDLLLAWVPESQLGDAASIYVKVDLCDADSPPKQSYLVPPPPTITSHPATGVGHYAFAIPVSAVYSLLIRPPSIGWWYGSVIINSRAGDSFPPLFFHDDECQSTILQKKRRARDAFDPFGETGEMFWGGDEVLRWLKRYVAIERSTAEPNVYLVEPSEEDSLAFGGKAAALGVPKTAVGGGGRGVGVPGASKAASAGAVAGPSSRPGDRNSRDAGMDPLIKFVKETGWNIMEKFSKVTTFTRQAAQDYVLDNPRMPPQVRKLLRNPEVQTLQDEFDSARIYLARWAMGIAEQSERERNQRIWTARDVMELEDTDVGEFEVLDTATTGGPTLEQLRRPVTLKEWRGFFDPVTGRLAVTVDEVKERVFHGGLDPEDGVRKEAWLFLLGVYDWYSTEDERKAQTASLRDAYIKLKGAWWERQIDRGGEGEEGEWWREQRGRIEKDVHRTDRTVPLFAGEDIPHPDPDSPFAAVGTNVHMEQLKDMLLTYNEYNRDLGYVQGMSDLLSPIYAVLQDDALAFWGFQRFMDRMERNFLRDQSGMRAQLKALDQLVLFMDPVLYAHLEKAESTNFFFFFRMLLVWYKREFEWADVLRLWEALWTDYLSSSFHLFVALAILEKHRDVIMSHLKHFDEVLKYVNELSGSIDLESTLIRAEALFKRFRRLVEAIDKKANFPAPRLLSSPRTSTSSLPAASSSPPPAAGTSAGSGGSGAAAAATAAGGGKDTGKQPQKQPQQQQKKQQERVITPELRQLLSRKVEVVPHHDRDKDTARKGEGVKS
ncbi:hypothetical protein VTJ49DRAFT_4412 [Mycothermus thermophilus]|uniref:Rab-GAP TBC domain-containing protein n=1 Tax=Humicola insolens TaxID=85995 RepID=A0ABR3V5F1_HUMIN